MKPLITKTVNLHDGFVPVEKLLQVQDQQSGSNLEALKRQAKQVAKICKGVLYRDDGVDAFGRPIFTPVAENTVTLGGAIAGLERLTGKDAAFKPNTLNSILNINDSGHTYDPLKTPIALFGCGIGGASMTFDEVYDPSPRQNNLAQLVPMMVAQDELTVTDADKYMMRSSIVTPNNTSLNCWYLKEFDVEPTIRSLWKDAPEENQDGTEITADVADVESTNGVESFANFKLVLEDHDVRSYFEAMGQLSLARINTIGLFMGEKVMVDDHPDYVNVRLFSVLNLNNEPLAERKRIVYYYRIYALI